MKDADEVYREERLNAVIITCLLLLIGSAYGFVAGFVICGLWRSR